MASASSPEYDVIKPEDSFRSVGRSYQDLIELWAQWLISDNPDAQNYGDVIFLRGLDFPESPENTGYSGQPTMMNGTRSLNICDDQFLFLPVICTMATEDEEYAKTAQERNYIIWRDTMQGDNPPSTYQICIDGNPLDIGKAVTDLKDFITWSRDFTLHVPDVPYGRSLKDYLDLPITTTGDLKAMIGGYCILFKFKTAKTHSLVFQARGIRGPAGQYFASGIYTINVTPCPATPPSAMGRIRKAAKVSVVQRMFDALDTKKQKNQLANGEYKNLRNAVKSL